MFKVRHKLIDLAETGLENTALSPCFRICGTVNYRDLNIAARADPSCEKARSISEILRVTYSVAGRDRTQSYPVLGLFLPSLRLKLA